MMGQALEEVVEVGVGFYTQSLAGG